MSHRAIHNTRFGWQIAIAILLVLAVLAFSIPSVRASLSEWLGLSVAPSNQMPAAAVTLVAASPAAPTAATAPAAPPLPTLTPASAAPTALPSPTAALTPASSNAPAEVQQMSAQAGWNILGPGQLPAGYQYQSVYFDTNHKMVILTYLVTRPLPGATDPTLTASKTITLLQAQQNDFVPMQTSPDAVVTDVQVNGQPAAYVVGAWDTQFVKDDQVPNGGKMVSTWRSDLPLKNLYWQVGNVYLLLMTDDDSISQQELTDMAASIHE